VSRILVTGGAGFIGSTYVRTVLDERPDDRIVVFDKLTYAGRKENLEDVWDAIEFVEGAIENREAVRAAMEGADLVVNFAAESHVDRSIADQDVFAITQVIGTSVLLDAVRELGVSRFLQVSTDEVYGSIDEGTFTEDSPIAPSSPYSAIEALIARGSNNYGPRQYPEKLIPLMILNALQGDPLPVYGDGRNVRNWIHAEDFARAIDTVLQHGEPGEVYNAGGPDELENLDVVRRILSMTGRDESLIRFVDDRKGHDRRYSLSSEKVRGLGWEPRWRFEEGLPATVEWYRENEWWWKPIRSGEYREYYERHYGTALG
jgi:dTDP-glucose 4,6-dehydratase